MYILRLNVWHKPHCTLWFKNTRSVYRLLYVWEEQHTNTRELDWTVDSCIMWNMGAGLCQEARMCTVKEMMQYLCICCINFHAFSQTSTWLRHCSRAQSKHAALIWITVSSSCLNLNRTAASVRTLGWRGRMHFKIGPESPDIPCYAFMLLFLHHVLLMCLKPLKQQWVSGAISFPWCISRPKATSFSHVYADSHWRE